MLFDNNGHVHLTLDNTNITLLKSKDQSFMCSFRFYTYDKR